MRSSLFLKYKITLIENIFKSKTQKTTKYNKTDPKKRGLLNSNPNCEITFLDQSCAEKPVWSSQTY